jgi:hypothetical protein
MSQSHILICLKSIKTFSMTADHDMKDETTSPILFEQKQKFTPWVEKYRPSKDDEFSHQTEVVSTLRQSVLTG